MVGYVELIYGNIITSLRQHRPTGLFSLEPTSKCESAGIRVRNLGDGFPERGDRGQVRPVSSWLLARSKLILHTEQVRVALGA